MPKHFGRLFRVLHWCLDQSVTNALAKVELTAAQGPILGYLSRSPQPPCPRDIEQEFHLTHPTVSGLLSRLEKKGFVEFRPDEQDRRCKRIYILPKGEQMHETMHRTILETEERLVAGFTQEEQDRFHEMLLRAIDNMGANPCKRKQKEEQETW